MVSGIRQRQLAGATQQRQALRPPARGRHRDSTSSDRTMLHHKTMVVDGGGRRSARRTSTTALLRTTRRATCASTTKCLGELMEATYRDDPERLHTCRRQGVPAAWRVGERTGIVAAFPCRNRLRWPRRDSPKERIISVSSLSRAAFPLALSQGDVAAPNSTPCSSAARSRRGGALPARAARA